MIDHLTQLQKLIREKLELLSDSFYRELGIKLVYLFGSFVTERFDNRADVDIALLFEDGLKSTELFRRSALFQAKAAKIIDTKLDVSILNLASPLLKYEVVVNGEILFCD